MSAVDDSQPDHQPDQQSDRRELARDGALEPAQQNTSFPSGGGTAHGYRELPPGGTGPGLVVIQEWWGLTTHVADLVRRFAADGFVALAPDLYGGATTHDGEQASRLMRELPPERAARDLAGAVDALLADPAVTSSTVGVVGFCMGGGFVLTLAAQQGERVSAAVPFYGLPGPEVDFSHLSAAVQGHFATRDRFTREDVEAVAARVHEQSGVRADLRFYEADHAFVNDERPAYDEASATAAWAAATAFLHEHVR